MTPDSSATAAPVPYAKLDTPQSLNLYTYGLDNPVTNFDLDGHRVNCTPQNANGAGCQYIAKWRIAHGMSVSWLQGKGVGGKGLAGAQTNLPDFVSISYWPEGAHGAGHVGVAVDSNNTQGFATSGHHSFWAFLTGRSFPGKLRYDRQTYRDRKTGKEPPHSYLHIRVSAPSAQAMRAAIDYRVANPGSYNLYFRNCADFVEDVLHAGGVSGVPHHEVFGPMVLVGVLEVEHSGGH